MKEFSVKTWFASGFLFQMPPERYNQNVVDYLAGSVSCNSNQLLNSKKPLVNEVDAIEKLRIGVVAKQAATHNINNIYKITVVFLFLADHVHGV